MATPLEELKNPNAQYQVPSALSGSSAINSSVLAPAPSIDYTQPKPTPVYPTSSVDATVPTPEMKLTQPESDFQSQLKSLMDMTTKSTGRTEYQGQQEAAAGLPGLLDTQKSISKRILGLQATDKNLEQVMQQQAEGRGITTGGQAPLTMAERRKNSIDANILGAQLSASQLDVASANEQVKKAVEMKFGPIDEKIKAATANLELLLKDPALSVADKNRANAQLAIQKQKETQLAKDKFEYEAKHKAIVDAAALGADAVTLQKMDNSGSSLEATQIAATAGFAAKPDAQPASVQEFEYFSKLTPEQKARYTAYQNEDANRKRSIAAAGVANDSGLNSKQVTVFNSIVDKYNKSPLVAANDRAVILKSVTDAVAADPSNASLQVSFIYSMIQALDTYQSAVREGEIGLISGTQGLGDKISNLPDKIANGTPLSANKIKEYVATSKLITDSINNAALKKQQTFTSQAKIAGIGRAFDEFTKSTSVQPVTPQTPPAKSGDTKVWQGVTYKVVNGVWTPQ